MSINQHINIVELDDEQLAAVRDKLRAAGVKTTYGDPAGTALEQLLEQVLRAARGARILLGDLPPDDDPADHTHARLA